MYRVVLDAGVLVSALIAPQGVPAALFLAWLNGEFEMVVSPLLLDELREVLLRPKFRKYATEQDVRHYVAVFEHFATLLDYVQVEAGLTPDPDDDYLVSLARASGANFLISGDPHLTRLKNPKPPVLEPRAFFNLLKED